VFLEQHGAELGERRRGRAVLERSEDRFPVGDFEREDPGATSIRAFEPVGEGVVADQPGEFKDVGAGMGRPAR